MARPDASGRLSLRYLLRELGWSPGGRVEHTVVDAAIIVTPSPAGKATIGARGDLMIPAAARSLAGLDPDGQVVLVAALAQGALVLHYRNGQPISSRRYDHIWKRIGEQLP